MNCRTCQRQISSFIDAELEPAASEAVREHLAQCPECRSAYERMAALERGLKAIPLDRPHPSLAAEVKARVSWIAERHQQKGAFPKWIRVPLAALIILLALGLGNLAGRSMFSILGPRQPDGFLEMVASATDHSLGDVVLDVSSEENGQ